MRLPASIRHITRPAFLAGAFTLTACGGSGGGEVTGPPTSTSPSCQSALTVALAVGETRALSSEQAACFTVQGSGSTRYVLAGFDTRAVDAAQVGAEPSLSGSPTYTLGTGGAPSLYTAGQERPPVSDAVVRTSTAAAPTGVHGRGTPWQVGERFAVQPLEGSGPMTARVVRVQDGRVALAIIDQQATGHASRFTADVERALDYMSREGFAVLDAAYGARRPVTGSSGQLLVVLSAWNPDLGAGASMTEMQAGGPSTVLWMNLDVRPGMRDGMDAYDVMTYRLKVLAHELAHAWQARFMWDTRPHAEARLGAVPAWAGEGGADFVSLDVVRRYLNVGLQANWDWAGALRSQGNSLVLALEPASARGRLAGGYFDASSFMRDLQQRLVRRGVPANEALAEVAQGSLEGWHGVDGAGERRRGLTARMRGHLGAWDPAEAALMWTLAQAADEQTANPELNNPLFRSAVDGDSRYAWEPASPELVAGGTQAHRVAAPAGGAFWVKVRSDNGGTVAAAADVPARWMIARVR